MEESNQINSHKILPPNGEPLIALITCSKEKSRDDVFARVAGNLIELNRREEFFDRLIVFDNDSNQPATLKLLKQFPRVYRSSVNVGYWTAIRWVLNNLCEDHKYIYLIESDNLHTTLDPVRASCDFLDQNLDVGSVRLQRFKVRFRYLYDKYSFLGRRNPDAVTLANLVTSERAWFKQSVEDRRFFRTNLCTKLPSVNRVSLLQKVFAQLEKLDKFEEGHLFRFANELYPVTAVFDGGAYTSRLGHQSTGVVNGSFVKPEQEAELNYFQSRFATMYKEPFDVNLV